MLGRGGSSIVYRVRDQLSGALYALKAIPVDDASAGDAAREAALHARLRHPHVVRYFGCVLHVEDNGGARYLCVLMEEMLATLDGPLYSGRLDAGTVRHVVCGVAAGVAYLHARPERIWHGDLKLENAGVVRGPGGELTVLVADFGAAMAALSTTTRTKSGGDKFTATYVSKERFQGLCGPCEADDMWALGWMVVELCAGRRVHQFTPPLEFGTWAAAPDVLDKHVAFVGRVDATLGSLVVRALRRSGPPLHARDIVEALGEGGGRGSDLEAILCGAHVRAPC